MHAEKNSWLPGLPLVCLLAAITLEGCSGKPEAGLNKAPPAALQASISDFEDSIREWEQRVASGEWNRMVADGSWTGLVQGDSSSVDPASYPQTRIAEIRARIDKLRSGLIEQETR